MILGREPKILEKISKYNHPNLQKLVTLFKDDFEAILIVSEYRKGQTL